MPFVEFSKQREPSFLLQLNAEPTAADYITLLLVQVWPLVRDTVRSGRNVIMQHCENPILQNLHSASLLKHRSILSKLYKEEKVLVLQLNVSCD